MPKLLDRVRAAMRIQHYSYQTEQTYLKWIRRYIGFHNIRNPAEMGAAEVEAFLSHLAVEGNVAASTQMIYTHVLAQNRFGAKSPLDV